MTNGDIVKEIADYRAHFDAIYVAGIPNLLNESGSFLSFLAVITATEALAGLHAPTHGSRERFRAFVKQYFPAGLREQADELWKFRNAMVHSFNPGPYAVTFNASRVHLSAPHGPTVLNAEDFYAAMLTASQAYFKGLERSEALQQSFSKRIKDTDGGALESWEAEYVGTS